MPQHFTPDVLRDAILKSGAALSPDPAPQPTSQGDDPKKLFRMLGLPVMIGGQAADGISTIQAINRPNTHESNSAIYGKNPSSGRIIATKAAVTAPSAFLLDKLAAKHPKLALALALMSGGIGMGAAIHNSKVGKK